MLLHLDSDSLCCSSTYAQSLAFCEASNQKLLSMWVINDQKGHYGFILSIELFNRDETLRAEAVISAGEEDWKCYQEENSEQGLEQGRKWKFPVSCFL